MNRLIRSQTSDSFPEELQDLQESLPATRARTRVGRSQLVSPLKQFSRREKPRRKVAKEIQTRSECSYYPSEDSDAGITSENTPTRRWADYNSESSESFAAVMAIDATSDAETRFQEMSTAIENLTKAMAEKDAQITFLTTKLASHPGSSNNPNSNGGSFGDENAERERQRKHHEDFSLVNNLNDNNNTTTPVANLTVQQLQMMIADTIRAQYGGASQSSLGYAKPYSRRIDELLLPVGYQPPKFQQFEGRGNPKQHIAHFIETCNNAGTYGDMMVKQFVRSLKGVAFEWYTDIRPGSIDSWDQLERDFLTRFYSTRRIVGLPELAGTKQRKDEPVTEFIERWRNLVLNCKERISESSSIDMCVQGMQWGLLYNLQANMPRTFEELATRAHDLEVQIQRHGSYLPNDSREKKEVKKEVRKDPKTSKGNCRTPT